MGLEYNGKTTFSGKIEAKVPTPNYSGVGGPGDPEADNPYTGEGPLQPLVQTFSYTGSLQNFVVPTGVTSMTATIWAAGGAGNVYSGFDTLGGCGGYCTGILTVVPGTTLDIIVGGGGQDSLSGRGGGYGGGGLGGNGFGTGDGGGGGGRSSIGIDSATEIITAGGGGGGPGGTTGRAGAPGGGLNGVDALSVSGLGGIGGQAGPFSPVGGNGINDTNNFGGGAGGGGYVGGGSGTAGNGSSIHLCGGGGGASFGDVGVTSFSTTAGITGSATPGETGNSFYMAGIGEGGFGGSDGGDGLIVIEYIG